VVLWLRDHGEPGAEPRAIRDEVRLRPGVEVDAGDDLLGGRVREDPAGVGQPDRLGREAELGLGELGDHELGGGQQVEELAARRERGLADERHLVADRHAGQLAAGGVAILPREREDPARLRSRNRLVGHRA